MALLRNAAAWAAVQVVVLTLPASAAACAGDTAIPGEAQTRQEAAEAVLCVVNAERAAHGLRPVRRSRMLARAARAHSVDMVRRKYFSHISPSGEGLWKRIARTGYLHHANGAEMAEALAFGADALATPRELVQELMASPPHRQIILTGRYHDVGVGLALGAPMDIAGTAKATLDLTFGHR